MYEKILIEKTNATCGLCEEYAQMNSTNPAKIGVMACEGACSRGEIARLAANYIAYQLAKETTVRICLGGAFTKDTGQRNLLRRAERVIAIEGCPIFCSSRMIKAVLPDRNIEIISAQNLYKESLPFGIDEVPEKTLKQYAYSVAETIVQKYLNNDNKHISNAANNTNQCCG